MLKNKFMQPKAQPSLDFKITLMYQSIAFILSCGVGGSVYADEHRRISAKPLDDDVKQLKSVVVVGNRSGIKTITDSPAPIDIISGEQLLKQGNTAALRDVLAKIIPSFSVATVPSQPNGYGAVARSAGLRGFGGGHTLVLVNGKRRHVGALAISKYGFEEGYQAADLDLIPIGSIARVEVLRDGAAAQYGSDAIAGVINIVLKSADHGGNISAIYGGREHYSGTKRNGETFQLNANVGAPLGDDGFVNLGFDLKKQDATTRAGEVSGNIYSKFNNHNDPREQSINRNLNKLGLPSVEQLTLAANAELPLNDAATLYSYTTAGWRDAATGASYRRPNSRSGIIEIFPNGTTPDVILDETDVQTVWGLKGDNMLDWKWDFSSSYGQNSQKHSTKNNLNPSLGPISPTTFGLQKYDSYQWVTNLDFKKALDIGIGTEPLDVAWGLDYRKEGWSSEATDPLAYKNGGYMYTSGDQAGAFATIGTFGARVLLPEDEADITRSNTAAYIDLGLDITKKWFVGLAGRFEHYDDSSGDTFNGKINSRFEFNPQLAIRGTASTGFIAPSLYQQGFASTGIVSTVINGVRSDVYSKAVRTDSEVAKALGAKSLDPTKSSNFSLGLTYNPIENFNLAIDTYQIELKDRIASTAGLTGKDISAILAENGFSNVNFVNYYANLFDTRTNGVDLVADYTQKFDQYGRIRWSFGFNWNQTKITDISENPSQLQGINIARITRKTKGMVTDADPNTKFTIAADWQYQKVDLNTRLSRYGSYLAKSETADKDQTFGAQWIVDLDATYHLTDSFSLTLGADNLLNSYPDKSKIIDTLGENYYAQLSPFGLYGGYYYGRVNYRF